MSVSELEAALRKAQERVSRTMKTDPHTHMVRMTSFEESRAARDAVLQAERNLAAAKSEPYAAPIEFPVSWDVGAPLPYLLQNDHRTFLTFFVRDIDPDWDGSYVSVRSPNSNVAEKLAVVEFERCICTKMGTPNDEVLHGHPLHGKGLEGYEAMLVKNSAWLKELEAINSVHSCYRAEVWRGLNHYILPFHDCTFECVAQGFKVEAFQMSLSELLSEVCKRLVR
jgi:hypothetical protein